MYRHIFLWGLFVLWAVCGLSENNNSSTRGCEKGRYLCQLLSAGSDAATTAAQFVVGMVFLVCGVRVCRTQNRRKNTPDRQGTKTYLYVLTMILGGLSDAESDPVT